MSDPVDALETLLQSEMERAGALGVLPVIYECIDRWRRQFGGCEVYLARRCESRRNAEVLRLTASGLSSADIADRLGVSRSQVRRIRSRRSSHLL
jgi:DNA invertase Pin-like site-specific DNA recombinase